MKRSRIRPVSARRLAEADDRAEVVRVTHERAEFRCEAAGLFGISCSSHGRGIDGRAYGLDCHELRPRGRGGSHLDPENTVSLCRAHHRWITEHPADAGSWLQSGHGPFLGRKALDR